jgi:Tfp pilus assembly protein PilX
MKNAMQLSPSRERGVVLIFTLIVLLILTIGGVALVRSMHSSLFSAGNLTFRRDLVNQGEQAASFVMKAIAAGQFPSATVSDTTADDINANYKASTLVTNPQGVPTALLVNDAAFAAYGLPANDIAGATSDVTVRYVIDRMCSGTGPSTTTLCVQSTGAPTGGTAPGNGLPPPTATVYRLSVRVSGPRSTQVFLQSTFTKPD